MRRAGLKIGYVPQHFAPDPSLPITVAAFPALFASAEAGEAALGRVGVSESGRTAD